MAKYKAAVDFSKYPDGNLGVTAQEIHDTTNENAATFPALPITMAAFFGLLTAYQAALAESLKRGMDRTTLKNNARQALEDALGELGGYVNLVAKGDRAIINLSGFPSYSTEHVQSGGGVTFVPGNVRWKAGNLSGAATLRWKGDGKGSVYEVQTCTGDPNTEANWSYRGTYSGGRADLEGFTPGNMVWGRVRKVGTGGEVGGWSDPAQERVG